MGSSVTSPAAEATKNPRLDDYLWHVHGNLSEQIKFADQKAGFVAVLATGVLGGLHTLHVDEHFPQSLREWDFGSFVGAAVYLVLIASVMACFWCIAPRRRFTSPRGFIFWGAIAAYENGDQFHDDLADATPANLTQHLSHQTYALSKICQSKYKWLNWAIVLVIIGSEMALFLWFLGPKGG